MSAESPSTELLNEFRPLNSLTEKQLVVLRAKAELRSYEPGMVVLELGSEDGLEYFLVEGRLTLESRDGLSKEVSAGSERAQTAIARLQPRKYKVTADCFSRFLVVQQRIVDALISELPIDRTVEFSARDIHSGHEIEGIKHSFEADLKSNNIALPSFPEVAMRIRNLLDDPNCTARDIGNAIASDPAITVKILKTCNSALYHTAVEVTSCQDAVVRLGFDTTRQLVNIFAMKELFNSKNPVLQARMSELWSHSREVASIAYVLAEITPGMNPEKAMLAGLIQDIGTVPILEYIERYPDFMKIEYKVADILRALRSDIGPLLLKEWCFQPELIAVASNSENWMYESEGDKADYVDVVVVAQVHALIGKQAHKDLPRFEDIPAFKKLGDNGLTPEQSQKVLLESHHRIAGLKALLTLDGIPVAGESS
jgi:HD-like signal output (HDOD) protein